MIPTATPQSLTDEELDRLDAFVRQAGCEAKSIEGVDGYFAALISGPQFVSPTEALDRVLGEQVIFDSNQQAADIIGLLMRHWNTIAAELLRSVSQEHVYLPILLEDDAGVTRGNDWATGFMRGVQARPGSWRELLESEEHGGWLIPMMMLAHEHNPDPELRPPPIGDDKREEIVAMMIAGLTGAYRYYEPQRRAGTVASPRAPLRRQVPKIGRNDPCPCASGRKYKHCCAQTMH